jgi:hypothetical protein
MLPKIFAPSTNTQKRGARRARQNKTPLKVISMTQQEAFERSLATSGDSVSLRGKFLFTATLTATPTILFSISPINLGSRAVNLSGIFSRYRFKYLKFRFLTTSATTPGGVILGILDDVAATGEPPTTASGLLEYRSSALTFAGETVPVSFDWTPSDKEQWNFCAASTDNRFQIPATLYGATTAAGTAQIEVDFSITFKGALDSGSS